MLRTAELGVGRNGAHEAVACATARLVLARKAFLAADARFVILVRSRCACDATLVPSTFLILARTTFFAAVRVAHSTLEVAAVAFHAHAITGVRRGLGLLSAGAAGRDISTDAIVVDACRRRLPLLAEITLGVITALAIVVRAWGFRFPLLGRARGKSFAHPIAVMSRRFVFVLVCAALPQRQALAVRSGSRLVQFIL